MDRELVERARGGDVAAFGEIVGLCSERLHGIAYRILRDRDGADDALQVALMRMWDDLPSLRDPDRFEGWSYRLVVRAAYREAHSRRRWSSQVRPIDVEPASDGGYARIADHDEMERAFRHLTPEHRAILVLHFYAGQPVAEIAETLGIPGGTVKSRLHYAVDSLRAACEAEARGVVARRTIA